MKKLTFSLIGCLLLVALVAASLKADLDGDGDSEVVQPWVSPEFPASLFRVSDQDKDGDVDLVETRGTPALTCNLDNDAMAEAVIRDASLGAPWAGYALGNEQPQTALIFIRGQIIGCFQSGQSEDMVLYVMDQDYMGKEADVDGDGKAEIIWQAAAPTSRGDVAKSRPKIAPILPPLRMPVTQ
ncbi:MAG: hypothetical protein C4310_02290 [Chloroflexota bacterium]